MINVIVASSDQSLVFELRSALEELDDVRIGYVAYSGDDLVSAVLRLDPDVVLVDESLGPEPAVQVIRDIGLRKPTCSAVLVSVGASPEVFSAAMEAGARGLVTVPVQFDVLRARVESAAAISANMRQVMATSVVHEGAAGRGRVVAFAGAKGGVGTTSVATHLALDLVRASSGARICLVDLDLEKGDVSALIDVRHRASVADVAKVAGDLSTRAVADAVVVHESGVHLLLTPTDLRDVEAVTPRALREVLTILRQDYDLVVLDVGAHVTPQQAAAVEVADEVVLVTTPDVLSLRGLRRSISQWEALAVRKETDVRILVNRASRQSSVSPEAVRQLTRAPVLPVAVPSMFRRLEPALNARDPFAVREQVWWRALRALAGELALGSRPPSGAVARYAPPAAASDDPVDQVVGRRGRFGRRERGSVSVELVGVLPFVLLVVVVAWQLGIYGMSAVWSGRAAAAASRAVAVGTDPGPAARRSVPDGVAAGVTVSSSGNEVTVRLRVPLLAPGVAELPATVSATRTVLREP